MTRTLYAIKDRVANDLVAMQMYCLMTFVNDQAAIRYFADAILHEESVLSKHPNDYELIKIADIDNEGNITAEHGPTSIVTGSALVAATTPKLTKEA